MKKIILISLILIGIVRINAQLPVVSKWRVQTAVKQGIAKPLNPLFKDTLKSGDTLFYIIPVSNQGLAKYRVAPYLYQQFKLITADTAVNITFYTSINYTKWDTVKNGATTFIPYAKAVAHTANWNDNYNGDMDYVWFDGDWIGIRYIAKTKTNFKTIPFGTFGTLIK